jgi:hypothetical protein
VAIIKNKRRKGTTMAKKRSRSFISLPKTNKKRSKKLTFKSSILGRSRLLVFVAIFGILGLAWLYVSRAATNNGIWVDKTSLLSLPTTGAAWDAMIVEANKLPADGSGADISNQDSNHDQYTLAAALACARTASATYCTKARAAVMDAVGTEIYTLTTPRSPATNQWLPVGRNLGAYIIAADVLNIRATSDSQSDGTKFQNWIASFKGRFGTEGAEFQPFESGSNASAQMGFVYSAAASYLNDQTMLTRAWDAFRTYAGDPTAPDREDININNAISSGWAAAPSKPEAKAVTPKGKISGSLDIGGAIGNDMARGGNVSATPGHTSYPWVGIEGFVPAALILHRAGYPAFEVADQAVKRTHDFLWNLSKVDSYWWDAGDPGRAGEAKHIVNKYYGLTYTVPLGVGPGRTVGYTDWTHPTKASLDATTSDPVPVPSDTTSPTTSITAPLNGATVSGTINVTANASDNVGVAKVELYRNNLLVGTDTASPYSFSWNTTTSSNGGYSMYSRAYDAAGNTMNSANISVTVSNQVATPDTTLPVVSIISPADGSKVTNKVTISGSATDNVRVTGMQIIVDGKEVAASSTGNISISWNTRGNKVAKGAHTIVVRATDAAGNFGEKTITVYK